MDKDLARAFTLARELIAQGKQWYICVALQQLYHKRQIPGLEYERAREIIRDRLNGCVSVEDWLKKNVPGFDCVWQPDRDLVDYRVRWLDSLIEEFS